MGMDESVCERRTRVLFGALGVHEHRRIGEEMSESEETVETGKNCVPLTKLTNKHGIRKQ